MSDVGPISRNIRLVVAYDGTDFNGFQVQAAGRTVQGELEEGLRKLLDEPVRISAAGRTDAGVHARAQTVSFRTHHRTLPGGRFCYALNTRIPRDISVLASDEVGPRFHARFSAVERTYRYYIYTSPTRHPLFQRYALRLRRQPSIRSLNRLAAELVGEHDFSAFASAGEPSKSKVRIIRRSAFFPEGPFLVYEVAADSFLWRMVRCIVGALLELESAGADEHELRRLMRAGDRSNMGATARAHGLVFQHVRYEPAHLGPAAHR